MMTASQQNNHLTYDIVFHLFSEQKIPCYLGIQQLQANTHIFIDTMQHSSLMMKQFLKNTQTYHQLTVNAYDIQEIHDKIIEKIDELHSNISNIKIAFNLTGGTKLMFISAYAAAVKKNASAFYFNVQNHTLLDLTSLVAYPSIKMTDVDIFIKLSGHQTASMPPPQFLNPSGKQIPFCHDQNRKNLRDCLWQNRNFITQHYNAICSIAFDPQENPIPFSFSKNKLNISLDTNWNVKISVGIQAFTFQAWQDFACFLTGGWFEEYVYCELSALQTQGLIYDLRLNLQVTASTNPSTPKHELDIAFSDGHRLYVIECKAGKVQAPHIVKLKDNLNILGGLDAKGILAACFPIPNHHVTIQQKIKEARIEYITSHFEQKIKNLINSK
jgi:hypothetical protein